MAVFRGNRDEGKWDNIELPHDTLEEVYTELRENGIVYGKVIMSRGGPTAGIRYVNRRIEKIITLRTYLEITPCNIQFLEDDVNA